MRTLKRISLGGWIFLLHFSCVAITIALPVLIAPVGPITDADHWYWEFRQFFHRLFFPLTFPVSLFMDQPKDGPLELFGYPVAFVPFFIILALNSLLIGYTIQFVVSFIRSRRRTHQNEEQAA